MEYLENYMSLYDTDNGMVGTMAAADGGEITVNFNENEVVYVDAEKHRHTFRSVTVKKLDKLMKCLTTKS